MSGHPPANRRNCLSSLRSSVLARASATPARAVAILSGSNCRCMMIGCSCAARATCRQGVQKRLKDSLRAAGSRSCNPLATEVTPIAERIETPASSTWPIWRPPDSPNRPVMADFAPRRTHRLRKSFIAALQAPPRAKVVSGHPLPIAETASQTSVRVCSPVPPRLRPVRAPSSAGRIAGA